jgi:hypothetical protein
MNQPWLTINDWPVRALDLDAAKNSATAATSSVVVNLPSTVFAQHDILDDLGLCNAMRSKPSEITPVSDLPYCKQLCRVYARGPLAAGSLRSEAGHEPLHWDAIRLLTASIPASSNSRSR